MAETGRYKRILDRFESKKEFHRLACLVHAGYVKNPLEEEVRLQFEASVKSGDPFNWINPEHKEEIGDVSVLLEIAEALVSRDINEAPIQQRFKTTLELVPGMFL